MKHLEQQESKVLQRALSLSILPFSPARFSPTFLRLIAPSSTSFSVTALWDTAGLESVLRVSTYCSRSLPTNTRDTYITNSNTNMLIFSLMSQSVQINSRFCHWNSSHPVNIYWNDTVVTPEGSAVLNFCQNYGLRKLWEGEFIGNFNIMDTMICSCHTYDYSIYHALWYVIFIYYIYIYIANTILNTT